MALQTSIEIYNYFMEYNAPLDIEIDKIMSSWSTWLLANDHRHRL
jgi:hypothetical protein